MNDEQLLLFRKILNIRNYSESTILSYNNALIQFKKWNYSGVHLDKDLLFKYVEYLSAYDKSYSYIKNSIMALKLYSELMLVRSGSITIMQVSKIIKLHIYKFSHFNNYQIFHFD